MYVMIMRSIIVNIRLLLKIVSEHIKILQSVLIKMLYAQQLHCCIHLPLNVNKAQQIEIGVYLNVGNTVRSFRFLLLWQIQKVQIKKKDWLKYRISYHCQSEHIKERDHLKKRNQLKKKGSAKGAELVLLKTNTVLNKLLVVI